MLTHCNKECSRAGHQPSASLQRQHSVRHSYFIFSFKYLRHHQHEQFLDPNACGCRLHTAPAPQVVIWLFFCCACADNANTTSYSRTNSIMPMMVTMMMKPTSSYGAKTKAVHALKYLYQYTAAVGIGFLFPQRLLTLLYSKQCKRSIQIKT